MRSDFTVKGDKPDKTEVIGEVISLSRLWRCVFQELRQFGVHCKFFSPQLLRDRIEKEIIGKTKGVDQQGKKEERADDPAFGPLTVQDRRQIGGRCPVPADIDDRADEHEGQKDRRREYLGQGVLPALTEDKIKCQ